MTQKFIEKIWEKNKNKRLCSQYPTKEGPETYKLSIELKEICYTYIGAQF